MKTLILAFLLFSISLFAQSNSDSIVSDKTKDLKAKGVKDFFYFETYCNGNFKLIKEGEVSCDGESEIYVFSNEANKSFLQKVNSCENKKIEIPDNILNYYINHFDEIRNEVVRNYQIDKESTKFASHSCFKKFAFYFNSTINITKDFDELDLTTETDEPNINFKSNNSLKLVKLTRLCEKVIRENYIN